jgi:hypothetical protein
MSFRRRNSRASQAKGSSLVEPSRRPCWVCGFWEVGYDGSRCGWTGSVPGLVAGRSGGTGGRAGRSWTRPSAPSSRENGTHQLGRDQRRERDALLGRDLAGLGARGDHDSVPGGDLLDDAAQPRHRTRGGGKEGKRLGGDCLRVRAREGARGSAGQGQNLLHVRTGSGTLFTQNETEREGERSNGQVAAAFGASAAAARRRGGFVARGSREAAAELNPRPWSFTKR